MPRNEQQSPAPEAPSAEMRRRAALFWAQSGDDLKAARRYLRRRDYSASAFHSFQAAINALTTVAYLHGHFQLPGFSPTRMLQVCAQEEQGFAGLQEACAVLEPAQDRNPFSTEPLGDAEREHVRECLRAGGAVHEAVKRYLKRHRDVFFAP